MWLELIYSLITEWSQSRVSVCLGKRLLPVGKEAWVHSATCLLTTCEVWGGRSRRKPLPSMCHSEAVAPLGISQHALLAFCALISFLADSPLEIFLWVTSYSFFTLKYSIVWVFPKLCERITVNLWDLYDRVEWYVWAVK